MLKVIETFIRYWKKIMIVCQVCKDRGDKTIASDTSYQCNECGNTFPSKLRETFRSYCEVLAPDLKVFEEKVWFYRHDAEQREYEEAFGLSRKLGMKPGDTVLEIGCGYGHRLVEFKRNGIEAHGIEWNSRAFEFCSKLQNTHKADKEVAELVPPDYFDFVLIGKRLETFWSPHRLVELAQSACKPGGRVHLELPKAKDSPLTVNSFTDKTWEFLTGLLDGWVKPESLEITAETAETRR